jgi:uncharacterized protein (DUF1697 family)
VKHVALLRGINLGKNNRITMADLVLVFEKAGAADVRTHIQSGNVIFTAKDPAAIPAKVAAAIQKQHGFASPVILRSATEMAAVPKANPFPKAMMANEDALHVAFLAAAPTAEQIAQLDPARSPGDSFRVVGRDLYLWLPNGVAHTKLTNVWFDKQLSTTSTVRNWRTTLKLVELVS